MRAPMRKLLAFAVIALAVACGGEAGPPPAKPTGNILVLDMKFEQPDEQATILAASLLLDGKQLAQFQQSRPEVAVVFSKQLADVAAGPHTIQVRIDAQSQSPTVYVSGGFATYAKKQHPLIETGGPLKTGQAYSWQLELAAPPAPR
jgi:hypothetical protein